MYKDKLHYYIQNPPRDGRNRFARAVDFFLVLLLAWLATLLAFEFLPQADRIPAFVIYLTLAAQTVAITKFKIYKKNKMQMHWDIWFSARKCRENLQNIKSRQDFADLVRELLVSALPFELLEPVGGDPLSNIDLSGSMHDCNMAVMCLNPQKDDHKITVDVIKNFWREMKQRGYSQGIVVTTGSFTDDAQRFTRRMWGVNKIYLVDSYHLLHLAKRAGHPIFPAAKWQEKRETRVSGLEVALSIKENIVASRKKSMLFTLLGMVFLVLAAFQEGFIGYVYLVFGVINLFVGFSGIISSLLRKNEPLLDWL